MSKQYSTVSALATHFIKRPVQVKLADDAEQTFDDIWGSVQHVKSSFASKKCRIYFKQVFTFLDTPDKAITSGLSSLEEGNLDGNSTFYTLVNVHSELNRLNGVSKESQYLSIDEAINRQRLHQLVMWYCDKYSQKIREFEGGRLVSRYCQFVTKIYDDHFGETEREKALKSEPILCKL